jgi:hypothetical protein
MSAAAITAMNVKYSPNGTSSTAAASNTTNVVIDFAPSIQRLGHRAGPHRHTLSPLTLFSL